MTFLIFPDLMSTMPTLPFFIAQAAPSAETAAQPEAGQTPASPLTAYTRQPLERLQGSIDREGRVDGADFAFLAGFLTAILLLLLFKLLRRLFAPKQRLKVKLEDGSKEVITARAIKDLQRIASRDLGTPKPPKIFVKQKRKAIAVTARMQLYENQKGPEMKARLEESLRREFQEKHGLDVASVEITIERVKEGQGPSSNTISQQGASAATASAVATAGAEIEKSPELVSNESLSPASAASVAPIASTVEPAADAGKPKDTEPASSAVDSEPEVVAPVPDKDSADASTLATTQAEQTDDSAQVDEVLVAEVVSDGDQEETTVPVPLPDAQKEFSDKEPLPAEPSEKKPADTTVDTSAGRSTPSTPEERERALAMAEAEREQEALSSGQGTHTPIMSAEVSDPELDRGIETIPALVPSDDDGVTEPEKQIALSEAIDPEVEDEDTDPQPEGVETPEAADDFGDISLASDAETPAAERPQSHQDPKRPQS
jgi:hypothetical protein